MEHNIPDFTEIKGQAHLLPCQNPPMMVTDNDVILNQKPADGGFGSPLDRDPEMVLRDVMEGYISPDKAESIYKIALSPDSKSIDREATKKLPHAASLLISQ